MGGVRTDCHRLIRAAVSGRRSRHHAKDKQRFVASVAAYDSLPGHHFTQVKSSRIYMGAQAPRLKARSRTLLIDFACHCPAATPSGIQLFNHPLTIAIHDAARVCSRRA
jgi:hypothetical protein